MSSFKKVFHYKRTKVWLTVSSIVLVLFLLITILANTVLFDLCIKAFGKRMVKSYGGGIYYESDYEDKDDAFEKSNLLNEKICEEGIVLLKNENNVLPFKDVKKISVFGKNSVNLSYGGSGSGAFKVTSETPTIYNSLEDAGFSCNPKLKSFYESSSSGAGRGESPKLDNARGTIPGFATGETPLDKYSGGLKSYIGEYTDAALVVITRIGGESFDLPRTMLDESNNPIEGAFSGEDHYLELDKNEQELLVEVCNNFEKVVLIVNCSTSFELGFLDDIADNDTTLAGGMQDISSKIDGAVWIGGPGWSGIMALGRVLNGKVNPSGRTIDTYQRDFTQDPTYQNFADNLVYKGNVYLLDDGSTPAAEEHYVDYEEGIYVGYRYYETRGAQNVVGGEGEEWYKNHVVYPFGYGLSYTTFEWNVKEYSFKENEELDAWTSDKDQKFSVTVNVKNTGEVAGKDVVQVYITAPYNPGGIEKAYITLMGFVKTDELKPNESRDYEVTFTGYDFASYDYSDANKNEFRGYELDAGEYTVRVMKNSHTQVDARTFKLKEGVKYEKDPVTGAVVENRFDNVSFEENYGMDSLLTRNDWEGTFPANEVLAGDNSKRTVPKAFYDVITSKETNNPIAKDTSVTMPDQAAIASPSATMQVYKLIQFDDKDEVLRDEEGMILVAFDDPRWDEYLNLLTVDEMMDFTMQGAFQTLPLASIGLIGAFSTDGPVGFVYFMAQIESQNPVYKTCSYASECVIAATWNVELAYEMGKSVGNESLIGNEKGDGRPYSGWYAPAVNIHRTPFSGRNFEYYSEDPVISGKFAAEVVKGSRSRGLYCQVKHFAVNDQETHRSGVCTWLTEQAMREIYFKPFEMAVKDGGTLGVMSSFNRLGTLWTGGDYRLLTEVLRNEWGFKGLVITDFNTERFMDTKQMCYAGGDLNLATTPNNWKPTTAADYTVLRKAVKNIIYTTARSNDMNGCGEGGYYITYYAWWETLIIVLDIVLGVGILASGAFVIATSLSKSKKENQVPEEAGKKKE